VRFELGPRALRLAAADRADAAHTVGIFRHLAEVEVEAADWLGKTVREPEGDSRDAAQGCFERLRGINFARIQRRGPDEAERIVEAADAGKATVHQVVAALVRHDGEHLAELRGQEVRR